MATDSQKAWDKFVELAQGVRELVANPALPNLVHRAMNNGASWFAGSLALFAIALAFGFEAWTIREVTADNLRKTVSRILSTPQEPGRSEEYLGIIATVLSPLNETDCPDCEAAVMTTPDVTSSVESFLDSFSKQSAALSPTDETPDRFAGIPPEVRWRLAECPDGPPSSMPQTFGIGPGLCLVRAKSLVFIPPTELLYQECLASVADGAADLPEIRLDKDGVAECVGGLARDDSSSREDGEANSQEKQNIDTTARAERLRAATALGLIFSLAAPAGHPWFHDLTLPHSLPQAYFISPDGVFAHIAGDQQSLEIVNEQPLRRWESRPYFQALLRDDQPSRHRTRVYLDITGLGLVQTTCQVLFDRSDTNIRSGVVCVDAPVHPCRLHPANSTRQCGENSSNRWIRSWSDPVLDYRLFEVPASGSDKVGNVQPTGGDPQLPALLAKSEDLKATGLAFEGDEFLITVKRGPNGRKTLLRLKPSRDLRRPDVFMITAVSLLLVSIFCLVACARSAAKAGEAAESGSLLRNLPVAVVQLDEDRRIRFANDRAEEILARPLHRFGLTTAAPEPPHNAPPDRPLFAENFDNDFLIEVNVSKGTVSRPKKLDKVNASRTLGVSSEYYCRLHPDAQTGRPCTWIRVLGSPARHSRPRSQTRVTTFGAFERVPPGLAEMLENYYRARFAPSAWIHWSAELESWLQGRRIRE